MKIMVQGFVEKEVGMPTAVILLPMGARIYHGLKTTCAVCRTAITDETFIGAFFADGSGVPNKMIHVSCAKTAGISIPVEQGKLVSA